MAPSSVASVSFFCLLVLLLSAEHGGSSHASYKLGSAQYGDSQQPPTPATNCSSMATGLGDNMVPILHREHPCSPLHVLPYLTEADILRHDALLIRRRFSSESSPVSSLASSPAATTIPANGSFDLSMLPGALDYSVLLSYGTPEQQLPVFLDTSIGASLLRCKPCTSGSDGCDPAFDTSRSNTFALVPCGSQDCPANCSGTSACPFNNSQWNIKGKYAQDVLTLTPSMAVDDFRFVSVDVDRPSELPEAGTLDLSRNRHSIPSRLSPSASFSYCLPSHSDSEGFLYLGGNATARENNLTGHAPLVWNNNPDLASMYFVDLVGIRVSKEDLLIPAGTFGGNASANLAVGTTFTMLAPDIYMLLRDSIMRHMSQYTNFLSPGIDGFDTCFNFTGLHELTIPIVIFKFSNGEILKLHENQMWSYPDPHAHPRPFTMVCLAFSALDTGSVFSAVIGAYTLASTEVVYDVAGGKVGFIPNRC